MYIAQARKRLVHLVAIADIAPDHAKQNLKRVGWTSERYGAASIDQADQNRPNASVRDGEALVAHPAIDIVIEATGNPPAAVEHALAALNNRKHVVMVTVEADAFCGPLLARKAAEASMACVRDQPALICDLVDWARAAGFPVVAAGRNKWLPHYAQSTPETIWGYYGLTPEQASAAASTRRCSTPSSTARSPRSRPRRYATPRAHAGAWRLVLPARDQ